MDKVRTVTKNPQWKNVALSVQQPWASLICRGIKDIENRTWQTDYRGRLYIVASRKNATSRLEKGEFPAIWRTAIKDLQERGLFPDCLELPQSAVIGYVDLVDCTGKKVNSIWSMGKNLYSLASNRNPACLRSPNLMRTTLMKMCYK